MNANRVNSRKGKSATAMKICNEVATGHSTKTNKRESLERSQFTIEEDQYKESQMRRDKGRHLNHDEGDVHLDFKV